MNEKSANGVVAALLQRHGSLLEIAGGSSFRAKAFSRAADVIRVLPENIAETAREGRLRDLPGIGPGIAAVIDEILETGEFSAHVTLAAEFPESLTSLVSVPGIGAKTALRLFRELTVDSIPALEAALESGRILETTGFGKRMDATVRSGLEEIRARTGRTPLGDALPIADALLHAYSRMRPSDEIVLAGSARRWEVTVGDLDFVIATSNRSAAIEALSTLPVVVATSPTNEDHQSLELAGGLHADVYLVDWRAFGSALVLATGSERHVRRLGDFPVNAGTEEEVYRSRGLLWIPPELREGDREFRHWREIGDLVSITDMNGEFHAHTTWSDGRASIREMANAAAGRGYGLFAITDHSHGLGVAGGLDLQRLAAQREELNAIGQVDGVTLLAGAEVETRRDGTLDFDDETLASLDVVVASLHSGLRQARDEITERMVRVLRNRNVDIVAHPSGRLIERRQGGDFHWDRVFGVAAVTGTALEINADPARLDLDPQLAQQAAAAGCLITINCDAHSPDGLKQMVYGIAMARKAWLRPHQILNCWAQQQMLYWLRNRSRRE